MVLPVGNQYSLGHCLHYNRSEKRLIYLFPINHFVEITGSREKWGWTIEEEGVVDEVPVIVTTAVCIGKAVAQSGDERAVESKIIAFVIRRAIAFIIISTDTTILSN